jgi:hypothetical protein
VADEVAPGVADEVEGDGFCAAEDVEEAGGAAGLAVVDFAVENFGGEAESHREKSGLAGIDGEGAGIGFAGGGFF